MLFNSYGFLLVFLPMPLLMSTGFHLSCYFNPVFIPLNVIGMAWPLISYPIISRFYKRCAARKAKVL